MKNLTLVTLLFFTFGALIGLKKLSPPVEAPNQNQTQLVLDHQLAPWIDLGHSNTMAGLMWIQSVAYFGGSILSGSQANQMGSILKTLVALDSNYKSAYEWAGIYDQVPYEDAISILDAGIKRRSKDWRLHLFYANKVISHDTNYVKAANIMRTQKDNSEAPEYIRNTYKRFEKLTDDTNLRISLLAEKLYGNKSVLGEEIARQIKEIAMTYRKEKEVDEAIEKIREGEGDYLAVLKLLFKHSD